MSDLYPHFTIVLLNSAPRSLKCLMIFLIGLLHYPTWWWLYQI